MIIIDNVYIDSAIVKEQFVCDLNKCKGACCVDGDAGAPLEENETQNLKEVYPIVKKYLSPQAIKEIEKVGTHTTDKEFGLVTPDINGGVCVYGYTAPNGEVRCAIEKAFYAGEVSFKKPISCHLFPIRVGTKGVFKALNYEPRQELCAPACANGKKLKVPVYKFLQEPLTRMFGKDFFNALETIALKLSK